jgi:hypothetical protein
MSGYIPRLHTLSVVLVLLVLQSYAQGCSDAGICTAPGFLHSTTVQEPDHRFALTAGVAYGIGDDITHVTTPLIQLDYKANNRWSWQSRLTANGAFGNLGQAIGLGDLYLSGRCVVVPKLSLTAGVKVPLNDASATDKKAPLPMTYQSSLGTYDLLLGIHYDAARWLASAGLQQPLESINKNGFVAQNAEADYWSSRQMDRAADVLLRGSYKYKIMKKVQMTSGLLALYHTREDTYLDPVVNRQLSVNESEGLTINVTTNAVWQLSPRTQLAVPIGFPVVVRAARPDGLTRGFSIAPQLTFHF